MFDVSHSPIEPWRLAEVAEYDLPLKAPPLTILDIGANVGAWSLRCAEQYPDAAIMAFEPVLETAVQLERNTRGKNVLVKNFAVRSFTSSGMQMFAGDNDCTNSFHNLGRQNRGLIDVACIAAASIPSAELVKIDTEGCELEILSSLDLRDTLAIVVEYHRGDALEIIEVAEREGFKLISQQEKEPGYGILKFAKPGVLAESVGQSCRSASPVADRKVSSALAHRKVYIGMPTCGGIPTRVIACIDQFKNAAPLRAQIDLNSADCGVAQARNALTARFLATNCTHLMFWDSDIIATPQDIANVCSHDQPIVGGLYPIKMEGPLVWCGNPLVGESGLVDQQGLQQVRYIGTGFICIAREVFEKVLAADRDEIEYTCDHPPHNTEWDFWRMGVRKTDDQRRRYLTEDWYFCQRAMELGYKVYADTRVKLQHIGTATWPLRSQIETASS